jgi:P pilus assembly chaperone PapD
MNHFGETALAAAVAMLTAAVPAAYADGMVPETSVVIVEAGDGEGVMNVKNTDGKAALLYTTLRDLPEDTEKLLVVTPPMARVDAGETQLVRFIVANKTALSTERLKRVTFEGIPQKEPGKHHVQMTVRQDLPVIIRPKGLEINKAPWKLLKWSMQDGALKVSNNTPYVVRLGQKVELLPGNGVASLPKTYVLPGETVEVKPEQALSCTPSGVRLFPSTSYGYVVDHYEAPVEAGQSVAAPAASAVPCAHAVKAAG